MRHFRAEEELLLPALGRHGEVDQPEIVRVLTEHVDLRRRAQELEASTASSVIARRSTSWPSRRAGVAPLRTTHKSRPPWFSRQA